MTKILITGGAGFIGGSLAEKLVANPENYVVAVDDLSTGRVENLPEPRANFRFIKTNVNEYGDISAIMLAFQFAPAPPSLAVAMKCPDTLPFATHFVEGSPAAVVDSVG